jgi:hypothetical protein
VIALLDAGSRPRADLRRRVARLRAAGHRVLPKLKAAGADDATLKRIMVDNSRRFLAFVPKRARKA